MNLICPPKRFEDDRDPKYDPIRTKPWFHLLAKRRDKINLLKGAKALVDDGMSQKDACSTFSVDPREFRDYWNFLNGGPEIGCTETYHMVLDEAYRQYNACFGVHNLVRFIEDRAMVMGIPPRRVREKWEIDPNFLPKDYHAIPQR